MRFQHTTTALFVVLFCSLFGAPAFAVQSTLPEVFDPAQLYEENKAAVVVIINEFTHTDRSSLPENIKPGKEVPIETAVSRVVRATYGFGGEADALVHPLYHIAWVDPSTNLVRHKAVGSGFFIRDDGLIATNYHVVEAAGTLTVELYDGTQFPAQFVAGDPAADIALIRIRPSQPVPVLVIEPTDSDTVVGKPVLTIGHPYSQKYAQSVGYIRKTTGYTPPAGGKRQVFTLQVELTTQPGNSGGPLIGKAGKNGKARGIVFAKLNASDAVGFVIPAGTVARVIKTLLGIVP